MWHQNCGTVCLFLWESVIQRKLLRKTIRPTCFHQIRFAWTVHLWHFVVFVFCCFESAMNMLLQHGHSLFTNHHHYYAFWGTASILAQQGMFNILPGENLQWSTFSKPRSQGLNPPKWMSYIIFNVHLFTPIFCAGVSLLSDMWKVKFLKECPLHLWGQIWCAGT